MKSKTATLFWNGRSQAVRLPKECRFEGSKVLVERDGDVVILRPFEKEWTEEFWNSLGAASDDFERPRTKKQKREKVFA